MTGWLERSLTWWVTVALGYVVLVGGGVTSGGLFGWQAVTFGLGVSLFGGWLLWRGLVRRACWPGTGLELPLAALALAGGLSLVASPDWRIGLERLFELAAWAALFYLTVDVLQAGLPPSALTRPLVIVSGLALFIGVVEVYVYYQGHWQDVLSWTPYRLISLLGHPNLLAGLAVLALPFVVWEWRRTRRVWARTGLLLWGLCYVIVLPFTSSRGGVLGLMVAGASLGAWLFWERSGTAIRQRVVHSLQGRGVMMVGGVATVAAALVGLFIYQSLHPSHGGAFSGRLYIWEAAAGVIRSHFWLGAGPGRFGFEVARHISVPPDFWPLHAHSVAWHTFGEFGLIGFLALVGLVIGMAWVVWRSLRGAAGEARLWIILISTGLAGYAAQNLVDDQTHVHALMVPLMLVLALAVTPASRAEASWRGNGFQSKGVPLAVAGLPLFVIGGFQAQWLWGYAAFDQARLAYETGNTAQALALAQEAARRDPALAFYDVQAGLLAAALDDWPTAQVHFERALAHEDSLAFVWTNLGVSRQHNGDQAGAAEALSTATALAPRSPTIALTAGEIAEAAGNPQAAEAYYRTTLTLQPVWVNHPFWSQTEVRRKARAMAAIAEANTRGPYPQLWDMLADGRVAEARQAIDGALSVPDLPPRWYPELRVLSGDARRMEGDEAGAMQQYADALAQYAHPSIEGTGYAFWNTYGIWLHRRQPVPIDSVPGVRPLDVRPEMLLRFERLAEWTRAQGDCTRLREIDRQRRDLDPQAAPLTCP